MTGNPVYPAIWNDPQNYQMRTRKIDTRIRSGDLVRRFTKKQTEFAAKVSNDISEDINCNESKEELRMVIAYWSDVAVVESNMRARMETQINTFQLARKLMEAALHNK